MKTKNKMKTETTVTRFVARIDLVIPHSTLVKANEESKDYVYQRAGNGHYICKHGDTAHIIIEKSDQIGCSCGDFTHRCKDNEGCKHIADFLKRKNPPAARLDKRIAFDLIAGGWRQTKHGNLYLPDPESVIADREADVEAAMNASWQRDYPEEENKMEQAIDFDKLLKEEDATVEPQRNTMEETKMEQERKTKKPVWDADAWNAATQGNFASYSEDGIAKVLFTANDFEIGKPDKWGRTPYEFSVIQNNKSVVLSVASVRLMHALKAMLPLEGKRVQITRTGSGMDTKYEVQEVAE